MKTVGVTNLSGKSVIVLLLIASVLIAPASAHDKFFLSDKTIANKVRDTSVVTQIKAQLNDKELSRSLYFPLSAKRFYQKRNFTPVWTIEQKDQNKTWAAMLLIDCVLQFGLRHEDYHPKDLQYTTLHTILEQPGKISNKQKARFEILLTDALLNFMNNLHFGKLNPHHPASEIDRQTIDGFNTEETLTNALKQPAFMDAIVKVQPANDDYKAFQHQLHLIKGVYEGDCYETPEADVRKIAVNMERLRWMDMKDSAYIQINIPTYTLKLVKPDTTFSFKIIVGSPATPTPLMETMLTGLAVTQSPKNDNGEKRDEAVTRNFLLKPTSGNPKKYDFIYLAANNGNLELRGVSDKNLFKKQKRATSNGNITVERGAELAKLLLQMAGNQKDIKSIDKAVMNHEKKTFLFKKSVPVRVTYITAAIGEGDIIKYSDIYRLDDRIEKLLYPLQTGRVTK